MGGDRRGPNRANWNNRDNFRDNFRRMGPMRSFRRDDKMKRFGRISRLMRPTGGDNRGPMGGMGGGIRRRFPFRRTGRQGGQEGNQNGNRFNRNFDERMNDYWMMDEDLMKMKLNKELEEYMKTAPTTTKDTADAAKDDKKANE